MLETDSIEAPGSELAVRHELLGLTSHLFVVWDVTLTAYGLDHADQPGGQQRAANVLLGVVWIDLVVFHDHFRGAVGIEHSCVAL